MNVTAFSLKFCQHDIVPWCNLSQHLDLICALLHNSLQEGLGSNSANSSANEKSYPPLLRDLDIQQRSQRTEQCPPSSQNYMEMVAISKLHLTSEAVLDFSVLQWIQMDNMERIKGLAENPAAASELGFSRSIHFNFFPLKERRENLTFPHSVLNQAPAR